MNEFTKAFKTFYIIHTFVEYDLSFRGKFIRCQDKYEPDLEKIISYNFYYIQIDNPSNLKIKLSLSDFCYFDEKYISPLMDLSLGILKHNDGDDVTISFRKDFIIDKQIIIEVKLNPGNYIVIPRTTGYCMRKKKQISNDYPDLFNNKGYINKEIMSYIIIEIFYLYDIEGKGYLNFNQFKEIMIRLNKNYQEDEFHKLINKNCYGSDGITLNCLEIIIYELISFENKKQIREFVKNLGWDLQLYPYLSRFYSIHIYSDKKLIIKPGLNLYKDYDTIYNNILLNELKENINNKENISNIRHISRYFEIN